MDPGLASRALLVTVALALFGCAPGSGPRVSSSDPEVERRAEEDEDLLQTEEVMEPEYEPGGGSF
jgi:hypothetical protein